MKISQFIKELEDMKHIHGDLEVESWDEQLCEYIPAEIKSSEYSIEKGFIIVE